MSFHLGERPQPIERLRLWQQLVDQQAAPTAIDRRSLSIRHIVLTALSRNEEPDTRTLLDELDVTPTPTGPSPHRELHDIRLVLFALKQRRDISPAVAHFVQAALHPNSVFAV